jgi:hydroxymethylpyrimidine/phosphomethylpyrimidine kinase
VSSVHEVPVEFVRAQVDAAFDDIGVDAVKTGMLFSRSVIETVAVALEPRRVPLVVDPVMIASSGARLLQQDAVDSLVTRLFPLATVVTPNLVEAHALARLPLQQAAARSELAERIAARGAVAVIVTGGHGDERSDHLFDGTRHVEIPVERHDVGATHGSGCTHSATLTAHLARGESLETAARAAALAAGEAVRHGLAELGAGEGPVDVLNVKGAA